MNEYKIGQPINGKKGPIKEQNLYQYDSSGHTLWLCCSELDNREVEAVRKGAIDIAFLEISPVITLLCKIDGFMDWSDTPYSWHLVKKEEQCIPYTNYPNGFGVPLTIILVEASTGVVSVLRLLGLESNFSNQLHQAIKRQIELPFNPQQYYSEVQAQQSSYSSSQMVKMASNFCNFKKKAV
jgi:hypothetical protein